MLSVSFVLLVAQMRKEGGPQKPTPNSNLFYPDNLAVPIFLDINKHLNVTVTDMTVTTIKI
jgi:hypothetical protein